MRRGHLRSTFVTRSFRLPALKTTLPQGGIPRARKIDNAQVTELLLQAIETERGGIKDYTAAIRAAVNEDLRKEWKEYLEETRTHEAILTRVFGELGLDTEAQSPGRAVVAHQAASLVAAIEMAMATAEPAAAELVAAECVVLAET